MSEGWPIEGLGRRGVSQWVVGVVLDSKVSPPTRMIRCHACDDGRELPTPRARIRRGKPIQELSFRRSSAPALPPTRRFATGVLAQARRWESLASEGWAIWE